MNDNASVSFVSVLESIEGRVLLSKIKESRRILKIFASYGPGAALSYSDTDHELRHVFSDLYSKVVTIILAS
jgi:hypothetical protein